MTAAALFGQYSGRIAAFYIFTVLGAGCLFRNDKEAMRRWAIVIHAGFMWLLSLVAIMVGDPVERVLGAVCIAVATIILFVCLVVWGYLPWNASRTHPREVEMPAYARVPEGEEAADLTVNRTIA